MKVKRQLDRKQQDFQISAFKLIWGSQWKVLTKKNLRWIIQFGILGNWLWWWQKEGVRADLRKEMRRRYEPIWKEISPLVQISYYLENLDKAPTMFEVWGSPKGLWGDSCSARRQLVICRWGPPRKGSAPTQCSVHPRLFHIQPPDVAAGMQKLSRAGHIWCQGNVCSACSPVACKMFGQVAVLGGRCGAHVPLACGRGGQKVGWNQFFQLWLTPLLAARPIPTAISPHFGSNGVRLLSLLAPMSRILISENA